MKKKTGKSFEKRGKPVQFFPCRGTIKKYSQSCSFILQDSILSPFKIHVFLFACLFECCYTESKNGEINVVETEVIGVNTYHAVVFTYYDLCTKFVVFCEPNFKFP